MFDFYDINEMILKDIVDVCMGFTTYADNKCKCNAGENSMNEVNNNEIKIEVGHLIEMVSEENGLEGLNIGDVFVIQNTSYGVVKIRRLSDDKAFAVSDNIIKKHFVLILEEDICEKDKYAVDEAWVEELIDESDIKVDSIFGKCITVSLILPSGFVITEACLYSDEDLYDEEEGFAVCMDTIRERLFEFEKYRLANEYWEDHMCFCDHCNSCDGCNMEE